MTTENAAWSNLPPELWQRILDQLPAEDQVQAARVCSLWDSLIHDPHSPFGLQPYVLGASDFRAVQRPPAIWNERIPRVTLHQGRILRIGEDGNVNKHDPERPHSPRRRLQRQGSLIMSREREATWLITPTAVLRECGKELKSIDLWLRDKQRLRRVCLLDDKNEVALIGGSSKRATVVWVKYRAGQLEENRVPFPDGVHPRWVAPWNDSRSFYVIEESSGNYMLRLATSSAAVNHRCLSGGKPLHLLAVDEGNCVVIQRDGIYLHGKHAVRSRVFESEIEDVGQAVICEDRLAFTYRRKDGIYGFSVYSLDTLEKLGSRECSEKSLWIDLSTDHVSVCSATFADVYRLEPRFVKVLHIPYKAGMQGPREVHYESKPRPMLIVGKCDGTVDVWPGSDA